MKTETLVKYVEEFINSTSTNFEYKIYDSLKMDNIIMDVNKINGIARISSGVPDPISGLGQSSVSMMIEFIYPTSRIEAVKETLENVSMSAAGLVIDNFAVLGYEEVDVDENTTGTFYTYNGSNYTEVELPLGYEPGAKYYKKLSGTTGVSINYPVQGNYFNGTMGETAKSRLICYFDINEKAVLSNMTKIEIMDENGQYQNIPIFKHTITRHRLSTTNKYENNEEMKTINDGQSIDLSLAVPSIKDSIINQIKDDMLLGLNVDKTYTLRFTDESGPKVFENMIASGDFSYEIVAGDTIVFKILFVYKKEE